ncbi:MAG: hypothetical protein WCJ30_21315 [Deltaproteobacteria bacterium]
MKHSLSVLALVIAAQVRTVDVSRPPWNRAMTRLQAQDPAGAARELERIAATDTSLSAWQRAYAWRWAGQLAIRASRVDEAREDFLHAREADPPGFDARMATMHLGEIAMQRRHDAEAARWLEQVEHDPDLIVRTYAQDRLRSIRERLERIWLRRITVAGVVLGALLLSLRIARPSRWKGRAGSLGRALLIAEGTAIAGALVLPRFMSHLALSGWMLAAVPMGLAGAALWATRRGPAQSSVLREVAVWVLFALAGAAALHLAWDLLWWSVERPIV